ncbi:ShlB/FhaC/HecB family hemolysin secretion/activation protein [Variovorax sp. J22P240]|uniref:ShlB/FhaC/HecB family hemolysin secretion/activation protein n=1 Tax=Variovorax sp. J22P240 TaxID=3053514 RepID=UPI0025754443|nr:ShlB/FhaC/HecB family hemolysin secretion/activation protein [Variovorax sp. J22P240]MDL9998619.1 ShlB/FhaC/HecB family hemolysin secretion/activation protein [Variovorax sp. J22P240]
MSFLSRRWARPTVAAHRAPKISASILSPLLLTGLAASFAAHAQIASTPRPVIEEQRQQERERALREQQERTVDARVPRQAAAESQRLPDDETPCFRIDRVVLSGERSDAFQWALDAIAGPQGDDSPVGRCLGTEGVNIVLTRVQQAVIAAGYVTSRVLAGSQDLTKGELTLTLIPGRIAAIRFDGEGTPTSLRTAIPARVGDLLNLRDIEQGLENLKRVPTAEADIQIEPSNAVNAQPGDSDLVVKYAQSRHLRSSLSIDDSGTESTGLYQAGVTVSVDNPFGLNDLFYVNATHSIDGHWFTNPDKSTGGQIVHYSVPYGDWLFSTTASQNDYHQNVAGYFQNYVYAGESSNAGASVSRLLYRDQHRKTIASVRAFRRSSHNYIDDTEIEVQRRVVGGWELGLNHREFIGPATLDGNLVYRRGTGAFGSIPAPEEPFGEGTSRMRIITADLGVNLPFELNGQTLRYSGLWRAQWNRTPLTPQDMFSIGGRFTVRGFDGELTLSGDRGWLVRNDIGLALGASGAELYAGIDYGEVGGLFVDQLIGSHLAGGVIGLRGVFQGLNYDMFVGAPINKPEGFRTASVTAGFNLNFSF